MRKNILSHIFLIATGCGLVCLWLLLGPGRSQPKPSPRPTIAPALLSSGAVPGQDYARRALAIEAERDQIDQTVWGDELRAEAHEDVFIKLWDNLRASSDPAQVLGAFSFRDLVLPEPAETFLSDHGIVVTRRTSPGRPINPAEWRELLTKLKAQGYELAQSEWRHTRFDPAGSDPARSQFAMTLHLVNPPQSERVIVRGTLDVRWAANPDPAGAPIPERIEAQNVEVLTQRGAPAFQPVLATEIKTELNPIFIDPLIVYDLNGDGLSEIILVGQNLVYWNLGQGRFQADKLCQFPNVSINCAVIADFNGDGFPDLLGADRDGLILFVGDRSGRFASPAQRMNFTSAELPNAFVLSAGDINGDGALDVWLGQYKLPYVAGQMPTPYYDANDGFPSFLLINDGTGHFKDSTADAGLATKRFRRTYSASFIDLDRDGDLDLVVVSDFAGVDIYLNDGQGHFTDATASHVDEPHAFGMAHSFGDYDGDGQLDLFVVGMNSYTAQRLDHISLGPAGFPEHQQMRPKMAYGNRLFLGRSGRWEQTALSEEVARSGWSWGATSFDFDNDGDLDIYVVNGHKSRASAKDYETQFWRHDIYTGSSTHNPALDIHYQAVANRLYGAGQSYGGYEKNRLFLNQRGKSFLEMGFLAGVAMEQDCRNVVSDDLDGDGRLDLIVTTQEVWPQPRQTLHVFRNQLGTVENWIGLRLSESGGGHSPVGAVVTLTTPEGAQTRHFVTGDSYRSQHSATAHFGLGAETHMDALEVRWPNGDIQRVDRPSINHYHSLPSSTRR